MALGARHRSGANVTVFDTCDICSNYEPEFRYQVPDHRKLRVQEMWTLCRRCDRLARTGQKGELLAIFAADGPADLTMRAIVSSLTRTSPQA
ncbi:hypothetical protein GCM10028801_42480 [Nocardioides maradonensis]